MPDKNRRIAVYVPERIYAKIEKMARREGLGLSTFVRRILIKEVEGGG